MISDFPGSSGKRPVSGRSKRALDKLLGSLVKLWTQHKVRGFKTRHAMGRLINEYLGSPDRRQKHGAYTMRSAAERLNMSVSELSRMRWLSYLFSDGVDQLPGDCRDWTSFKEQLPALKAAHGFAPKKPDRPRARTFHRGLLKSARTLRDKIRDVRDGAVKDLGEDLFQELQELAKEIDHFLHKGKVHTSGANGEKSLEVALT